MTPEQQDGNVDASNPHDSEPVTHEAAIFDAYAKGQAESIAAVPTADKSYFIHAIGTDLIKIGKSKSVLNRLSTFATSSPFPLQLLFEVDTPERELHLRFVDSRIHGEWFKASPDIIQYVNSCGNPLAASILAEAMQCGTGFPDRDKTVELVRQKRLKVVADILDVFLALGDTDNDLSNHVRWLTSWAGAFDASPGYSGSYANMDKFIGLLAHALKPDGTEYTRPVSWDKMYGYSRFVDLVMHEISE